jgi:hypothetical protein
LGDLIKREWTNVDLGGDTVIQQLFFENWTNRLKLGGDTLVRRAVFNFQKYGDTVSERLL